MASSIPPVPRRFPCWVRAVYSWSGENKGDLGFIEGDMIECLHAGDGLWWFGRLKRNGTKGSFPCNFIEYITNEKAPASSASAEVSALPAAELSSHFRNESAMSRQASPAPSNYSYTQWQSSDDDGQDSNSLSIARSMTPPMSARSSARPYSATSVYPVYDNLDVEEETDGYISATHSDMYTLEHRGQNPPWSSRADDDEDSIGNCSLETRHDYHGGKGLNDSQQDYASGLEAMVRSTAISSPVERLHTTISQASGETSSETENQDLQPDAQFTEGSSMHQFRSSEYLRQQQRRYTPHLPQPQPLQQQQQRAPAHQHATAPVPAQKLSTQSTGGSVTSSAMLSRTSSASPSQRQHKHRHSQLYHTDEYQTYPDDQRPPHPVGNSYADRMKYRFSAIEARSRRLQGEQNHAPRQQHSLPEGLATRTIQMPPPRPISSASAAQDVGLSHHGDGAPTPPPHRTLTVRSQHTASSAAASPPSVFSAGNVSNPSTVATSISAKSAGSLYRRKFEASAASGLGEQQTSSSGAPPGAIRSNSIWRNRPPLRAYGTNSPLPNISSGGSDVSFTTAKSTGVVFGNEKLPASAMVSDINMAMPSLKKTKSQRFKRAMSRLLHAGGNSTTDRNTALSMQQSIGNMGGSNSKMDKNNMDFSLSAGPGSWQDVRRDVNRANSQSFHERADKIEQLEREGTRCVDAIELIEDSENPLLGCLGTNGECIPKDHGGLRVESMNFDAIDLQVRQLRLDGLNVPAGILAKTSLCRALLGGNNSGGIANDILRLRAIFMFHAEKIKPTGVIGEQPLGENASPMAFDSMQLIESRSGNSEEVAHSIKEMCQAVGLWCEVVTGYVKPFSADVIDLDCTPSPNHCWNVVAVQGEFRLMDASIAAATSPLRMKPNGTPATLDTFYFLTRPNELIYTHVPAQTLHQFVIPALDPVVALALPCVTGAYFRNNAQLINFDTSVCYIRDLECAQIDVAVPLDVELYAEVEVPAFVRDQEGDMLEDAGSSPQRKPGLAQVYWHKGTRVYRIKAVLPGDEQRAVLKLHAGRKGLLTRAGSPGPHPLAVCIPLKHAGSNPSFDFVTRHPTPHAPGYDLYVRQPQTSRLYRNNTYIFSVRQHSSMSYSTENGASRASERPGKLAKLAIQSPSGTISRLQHAPLVSDRFDGQIWELGIRLTESGPWRGLVLGERIGHWVVFAEWMCV